jgi:putative ABC transport system permease protein
MKSIAKPVFDAIRYAARMWLARPGVALLNALLLSLGVASITVILLVNTQIERAFERDLAGIDVVVGAKGSPLQLILAGVLHVDVPSGNIPLEAVRELEKHPQVKTLIPISLGDSIRGYRIVGTTPQLIQHYGTQLARGQVWSAPMQAVVGAQVAAQGLGVNMTFAGVHGLSGDSGEVHGAVPYVVVGELMPCQCVLDRLVLTATESVWQVHEKSTALDEEDRKIMEAEREVTMALIQYTSPLAAVSFPRFVNTTTEMQAAAPAVEITRLMRNLSVGTEVLRGFALVLLLVSALSLWMALWNALRERRGDLAMLRMLGATPAKVAGLLLVEALLLAVIGWALGVALGHGLTSLIGYSLMQERSLPLTGALWVTQEWWLLAGAGLIAALAALVPVWQAYRLNVLQQLQTR